ncbi:protein DETOXIFICATION 16-like isoform X2 [Humulus lupulus]|nr:protein DETOXIFICATION 16-like isoform X2 [Humulus lupulus]
MASALETFCGQSYGAKQYHMLGIHMQRGMIVLLVVSIPLAIIWFNAGQILLFLGQDPEISAEAGRYARFMIPSIFAYAVTQCHTKFLQTQNNVVPMMITAGITTLLHFFICWFLVFKSGLGNRGAAMANAISYWINALSLVLYVRISPSCKSTWTGFSMEAFHGIIKFLKLSIPSAVMLTLEIWSFEMMVLLSGFLPNPKLETSVLSISLNTCALVYMVPLGLSGVISTRVSNELGAGRPQIARLALCVTLCMVVTEGTLLAAVMILGRRMWGYCYSREEEVVDYVGQMMILISISQFFDGIQSILSGSVRGSGRQKIGAFANLAAYYLVGIPVAIVLAFVFHIGGKGLWMGIIVALIMQALCLAILTIYTDWEKEVNNASDRVHSTKAAISDELS